MDYLDFFERIKSMVKAQNLNLRQFIDSCGINYESYNSCKRYGNFLRADEALKIAKSLHTSVEYLITGFEPEIDTKSVIRKYLQEQLEALRK